MSDLFGNPQVSFLTTRLNSAIVVSGPLKMNDYGMVPYLEKYVSNCCLSTCRSWSSGVDPSTVGFSPSAIGK